MQRIPPDDFYLLPHQPTDADEIMAAFHRDDGNTRAEAAPHPISMDRIEWEHIQRVLVECGGNVSEGGRRQCE